MTGANPPRRTGRTGRTGDETKERLLLAALELFARQGVDAVSMRTINVAAGARNASAVHYHFGSKLGIVEAIIDYIREALEAHRQPALAALEARLAQDDVPSCRDVVHALFDAYARLNRESEHGRSAVRFLARLQTDMSPEIQALLNRDPHESAARFDALLARALPALPAEIRRTRYLYAWTLLLQGIASSARWEHTAFGDLRAQSQDVALLRFFDYVVGGLEAPVTYP